MRLQYFDRLDYLNRVPHSGWTRIYSPSVSWFVQWKPADFNGPSASDINICKKKYH